MESSEYFSLCWNNFHKNMCTGMSTLLQHEDLVDVTLAVEGQYLKAHKMILSVCSPYFKELFKVNPCKHPIVFMKDVSYIAMSDLLQFMYNGEVHVSQENLPSFLKTAEALQVSGLTGDGNLSKGEHAVADNSDSDKKKTDMESNTEETSAVWPKKELDDDLETKTLPYPDDEFEFYDQNEDFAEDQATLENEEEDESKPGTSTNDISITPSSISGLISTDFEVSKMETHTVSEDDKITTYPLPFNLLPSKSRTTYESTYIMYQKWRSSKKITTTSEETILTFFKNELSKYKSSSLWSKYSMLRSTIQMKEGVDIRKFKSLFRFLQCKAKGYKPTQSLSFNKSLLNEFLLKADNREHLLNKVVVILGVAGACRCIELVTLLTTNVEDSKTHILVKVEDSDAKKQRSFVIQPWMLGVNVLELVRSYMALRPEDTPHERFFINYVKEKCTTQPVGRHKLGAVPSVVAKYLRLGNHARYTGHCFKRTSAILRASLEI